MRGVIFSMLLLSLLSFGARGQSVSCPPNLDFELGNFTNWNLYTGSCCPLIATNLTGAVPNRHVLMSGTGTDPFGGFPVVAPASGVYSLKLGNSNVNSQAERARYYVHVPAGVNNYSIIFRYAVVFQDPGHLTSQQPRFEVKAYDSATNTIIPCSEFVFVATSNLPGFQMSTATSNADIWYKSWTTASIDLSGYAGKTVAVDFASGDCDLGAHFGYGYVDLNCGLLPTNTVVCSNSPTFSISAPPGFAHYEWRDSALATILDTNQNATIATPLNNTQVAVILTPYTGFGCPDTIYTKVTVSKVNVNINNNDTIICNGTTLPLTTATTTNAGPVSYSWTPSTGLSCTNCANPIVTLPVNTKYFITASNADNCSWKDSVTVSSSNISLSLSRQNISCFNANNGSLTVTPTGGKAPYAYSWTTVPVQTAATATGLAPGIYIVTVADSLNCIKTAADTITQPASLTATATKTNVSCFAGSNGAATVTASGGTAPYTYNWNTTPAQSAAAATGLVAGTYTATVTDAHNCTATVTVTISQPAQQLSASVVKTDVTCYNGNNGTATVAGNGGTQPYAYSWNTTPAKTTATTTGLVAGTYTVTVTDSLNCTTTANATIAQPQLFTASASKTDVSCFGGGNGTATVSAAGGTTPYTYSWNTTPAQTTVAATNLAAGNYTVTIADSNNCTATASVTVGQPAVLTSIATKTDISCSGGNNGTATVVGAGGTMPYSYSWSSIPVQTTAVATGLSAGTYTATLTDANGCASIATITLGQPGQLSASAMKTDVSCFNGSNGTATATATGGTGPYSYSWNTSPVQTGQAATGLAAGTYTATVIDSKGCNTNTNITITQPAALSGNTSTVNTSCNGGANGTATVAASGGTAPYTYSWNTTPAKATATVTSLAAGIYNVNITDAKGCTATATATIGEPAPLAYFVVKTDAGCYGDSNGTATVNLTGGTASYSYEWVTNPVQTTATAINLKAGTYTVQLKDAHNCLDSAIVIIGQPPLLVATTVNTNVNCYGEANATATVTPLGGTGPYTYTWNTLPVQTTPTATGLKTGKYAVTVTDAHGCKAVVLTDSIQEPDELKLAAKPEDATCPELANGSAVAGASGGEGPYSYLWNTTPVQTKAKATGLYAGNYTVTATDAHGCSTSASVMVLSLPSPVVDAGEDGTICVGRSVQLHASGAKTYQWSPQGSLSCAGCASPLAAPVSSTVYILIGADTNNCSDTDEVRVTVIPRVDVSVSPGVDVCIGDPVQLHAYGGQAYIWSPADDLDNRLLPDPVSSTDTAMTYQVVITENECFKDTLFQEVRVHKRPTVELGPDKKGAPGSIIQLNADTTNTISIAWLPKTGLDCYDCYTPRATLSKTITYTAVVSSGICEAKDDITIYVACDNTLFFIPNTFTPNGDGKNDRFWPMAQGVDNIDRFVVYDRWGEKIYEADNFPPNTEQYGWDGTFKAAPLPPDVYVYYLESRCSNGEKIFLKGDISLVR